jgi:hypothetical protein
MKKCEFCNKEFDNGLKLGGHKVWCEKNPNINKTKDKVSLKHKGVKCISKDKISDTIKRKIENNSWHLSFSKSRIYIYKGISFHGKWELEYAKWLDKNNIIWRRPNEKFKYQFEEKIRNYTPDFFLENEQIYIEIKGYPTKKDFAKWDQFPLNLKIINGKELFLNGIINSYRNINIKYKDISWKS